MNTRTIWSKFPKAQSMGRTRYLLLLVGVVSQALTIAITWPNFDVRTIPPNLPAIDLPQVSFQIPMVVSLAAVLISPGRGLAVHFGVLVLASVFDQMRLQPQYYANILLMYATINQTGLWLCRWLNVSMWVWAGIQKFLSPEWFGKASWDIVSRCGFDPEWYWSFALIVAIAELTHGLLAIFKPRVAAWTCLAMHLSITIFLSPLFYDANGSVVPWNLATAVIGFWTLRQFNDWRPGGRVQSAVVTVFMLYPLLFYVGLMDHTFAGVLYSSHIPRGLITTADGPKEIRGWGNLFVSFPSERRTFRIYFERVASPGDKLHIADPRRLLDDLYYLKTNARHAAPISRERFFSQQDGEVMGIGRDTNEAVFALSRAGVRMLKRAPDSMIYAIEIPADRYDPKLLDMLTGIPNLEQLQLKNANVQDEDLARLPDLPKLMGIGLSGTQVTDQGLRQLAKFRKLAIIEAENTAITAEHLQSILAENESE